MFDIHKIKPVHGWREFVGEVGIIVLGVAIALTAEQAVEAIHWRSETQEAHAGLRADLTEVVQVVRERELYARCIARRIRDVDAILRQAGYTGRLPPVGSIGQPSMRTYNLPSWTALTASGLASHLSREDVLVYSQLALAGDEMVALNRAEAADWASLFAIVGPGRPIGAAELGEHYRELSQIGYRAKLMRLWSASMMDTIRQHHVPLDRAGVDRFNRTWPGTRRAIAGLTICRPLGQAPSQYGNSPFDHYSLDGPVVQD